MAEDRSYVERNATSLARLRALVERLDDAQLRQTVGGGLTVADVLAHLAFWDGRSLCLAEKWDQGGGGPQPDDQETGSVDWINDAGRPLFALIPPDVVARFALSQAERADRTMAALSDEQLAHNRAVGSPINVARAEHRMEHVEELERTLGLGERTG